MNSNKLFDFSQQLNPHGEDKVQYEYKSGDLFLNIFYNENRDIIRLVFRGCSYYYFSPVPGYHPKSFFDLNETTCVIEHSGCVYEVFGSDMLTNSKKTFEDYANCSSDLRQFYLHLEWVNNSFDIIADGFEYETIQY